MEVNEASEESNLIKHARRELELIGEDPETIQGYLRVVQAFADMGHSGGSASVAIPVLTALFSFENLAPLTDNPDEWIQHENSLWQNVRNSEAFSKDGGKTFYLLSERIWSDSEGKYLIGRWWVSKTWTK